MTAEINYGVLTYDVPVENRGAYARLRSLLRKRSIMQTASAYLIPWGLRDVVTAELDAINEDKPPQKRVAFKIFPYAAEANEALEKEVVRGIHGIIKSAKIALERNINKGRKLINEAEICGDTSLELTMDDVYKQSLAKARKEIKIAQSLAIVFAKEGNFSDAIESAHKAVVAQVDAHRATEANEQSNSTNND